MTVGEVAAFEARYLCDSADIGYSQPDRRSWYAAADDNGYVGSSQNADCSSLVCGCVNYGLHRTYGVPWGHGALLEINDWWTGNMRSGLEARGFREVAWSDSDLWPSGGFQQGDVILSAGPEGGAGHVAIITDASAGYLSEAWIAEDGSIDGVAGDQTGGETRTVPYASHPYTLTGRWTSCHRFDEHTFMAQWSEFASSAATPSAQAAVEPPAPATHAHGVDVSSYQSGLDVSNIWADFVIVKATEDDDYVNPHMASQADAALSSGKMLGFYHFARPGDYVQQAAFFVDAVSGYRGRATLWLDWESNAVGQGPAWAKAFLDEVASRYGGIPGIYMNGAAVSGYEWSQVSSSYPLWYAGGASYSSWGSSYTDPPVPDVPYWGHPLIHQWTEDGRLPGYSGSLDLNRLADVSTWTRMLGGAAANTTDINTNEGESEVLYICKDVNGVKEFCVLRGGFPPLRVEGIIQVSYQFALGAPKELAPDFYDRTVYDWQAAYDQLVADVAAKRG